MRQALGLLALLLVMPVLLSAGAALAQAAPPGAQERSDPLIITGDLQLGRIAGQERWAGTGAPHDPYRLPAYRFQLDGVRASEAAIHIRNTQAHLVIADTSVTAVGTRGTGVLLENVRNVTVERVEVDRLERGIAIHGSSDVVVRDSTVRYAGQSGIRLLSSTGVRLVDNEVHIAQRGYELEKSYGNVFRDNIAATSSGQFGFYFDGEVSYANDIDTSNLVNDVPMRWYVGLKGTGHTPIHLPAISLHTESITNVAQVLFYRCWWLEVRDLYVSHGQTGVLVVDSERVTLIRPVAEKNLKHGIELRDGFDNKVLGANTTLNKLDGLRLLREDVDRVEDLKATHNGGAGLRIENGGGHTVSRAQLLRNGGDGLVASSSIKNAVVDSEAAGNGAAGFTTRGNTDDTFERNLAQDNAGPGFELLRNAGRVRLADLTSERNGGDGVRIQGPVRASIERLDVRDNDRSGLILEGAASALIGDSTIVRNAASGLRVAGGEQHVLKRLDVGGNRGDGLILDGTSSSFVNDSTIHQNGKGGIRLAGGGVLNVLQRLDVRDNGDSGIAFARAGLANQLLDVDLANHSIGVKLSQSPGTAFERVRIVAEPGQTGYHFDDEASYDVRLPPSNTVNGTSVRWYNGIAGTVAQPLRLENLTVTQPAITNVGQIVLYKASHVILPGAIAANGVRGVFVHASSNVTIEEAKVPHNAVGVELSRTLHSRALRIDASGSETGVRLTRTSDSIVRDAQAQHARLVVELRDFSRGNVVEHTNATNATRASVVDESIREGHVRADNFIADAGRDLRALPFQRVVFDGAVVSVPREHEFGLEHEWDFGDNTTYRTSEPGLPRVEHTYEVEGNHTVTYTMRTASGLVFSDTLRILVWEAPTEPQNLTVNGSEGRANLSWQPPANARWPVVYEVLRAMPGQPMRPIAHLDNETTFVDTNVAINDTYLYSVRALRAPSDGPATERVATTVKAPVPPVVEPVPLEPTARDTARPDAQAPVPTPAERMGGRDLAEEEPPLRLILLGVLGLTAIVLVFGGQFVQAKP